LVFGDEANHDGWGIGFDIYGMEVF